MPRSSAAAKFVNRLLRLQFIFSARCNIYISRLCYDVSVRLSVRLSLTEVHWRIIANLGFKFHFTAHCGRRAARRAADVLLAGGSSRAMLASARFSCCGFAVQRVQQLCCKLTI